MAPTYFVTAYLFSLAHTHRHHHRPSRSVLGPLQSLILSFYLGRQGPERTTGYFQGVTTDERNLTERTHAAAIDGNTS